MIVGAGSGNVDENGKELIQRSWTAGEGTSGGLERVALSRGEMPSHDHDIEDPGHMHRIRWGQPTSSGSSVQERSSVDVPVGWPRTHNAFTNIKIKTAGESEAHNNMPPFIVLTLCERLDSN